MKEARSLPFREEADEDERSYERDEDGSEGDG